MEPSLLKQPSSSLKSYRFLRFLQTADKQELRGIVNFVIIIFKWANPGICFHLFSVFFKQTSLQFLQQIYIRENFHPVYGAGIQTHDLWNMRIIP